MTIASGEAGARGIVFDPGGNIVDSFAWGLGKKTNNEEEWSTLMLGFEIITKLGIRKIVIIGDSRKVIQNMRSRYKKGNIRCKIIYRRSPSSLPK